jgi:hypothetical protein
MVRSSCNLKKFKLNNSFFITVPNKFRLVVTTEIDRLLAISAEVLHGYSQFLHQSVAIVL